MRRVATDIIEIIEDAGLERAVLIGHSMGVQGIFEAYRTHIVEARELTQAGI